ncbi:helix-turn-helix domain-containing protein [Commensalibacter nepenthis]|uniref:Helix-turn-helix transcriptional regulator n=1 Tax=Commensalibacter nepenthis TaxID=3043872 RepID=A0ABT6Q9Y7_9PROT|nr:helix-turn-helix transcriptional regulator [Commensalibacter sp. TBRC 10068]MDI2113043.1 helix-turn-helix transcriptional regulator [Commensalibacter sp. TBRC 10068]
MLTILMNIGQSLRKFRESKNLGQADIAAIVDTSIPTISHWENGRYYPEFPKLIALAEYFNIKVVDLISFGQESKDKISDEEIKLIKKYREAPENIRDSIKLILK